MKNILTISTLIAAVVALNVGCTASASVKKASSTTKINTATQVAYVTAPAK